MIRFALIIALLVLSSCSDKGSEAWRRSVCDDIVDTRERAD